MLRREICFTVFSGLLENGKTHFKTFLLDRIHKNVLNETIGLPIMFINCHHTLCARRYKATVKIVWIDYNDNE